MEGGGGGGAAAGNPPTLLEANGRRLTAKGGLDQGLRAQNLHALCPFGGK